MRTVLLWFLGVGSGVIVAYNSMDAVLRHSPFAKPVISATAVHASRAPLTAKRPHVSHLPFSEAFVAELESHRDQLHREAELVLEAGGWRFTRLEDDSLFARAGYQVGDLISNQRLDQALANFKSADNDLAKRTVRLLNRITD